MSNQQGAAQKQGVSSWGVEEFLYINDLRQQEIPWATIKPMVASFTPNMMASSIPPQFYRLKKRLVREGKIDAKTLLPVTQPSTPSEPAGIGHPAPLGHSAPLSHPAANGRPAAPNEPVAAQNPAVGREPAAALAQVPYASTMERVGEELVAMQQIHNATVVERNTLREEVIDLLEELQRVQVERENERESNLCTQSEENGICTKRRCRYIHRWGDRQVGSEDEYEE